MQLAPFSLDQWLDHYNFKNPPIEYDLAASTGPQWTARELMELVDEDERERLFDTKLVYCHGSGGKALREAIAEMQEVEADQVQIVTGASEALLTLFFLAAEPGANVVLPFPCFPPTLELPRALRLEVRLYHLRRENEFKIDLDEIKALVDGDTKLILVNSPHNPTGATLTDDEMRLLHDYAVERGIRFVSDEVYHPVYHGRETSSAARLPHSTVLGDFSKAFCLSGLRTGWIVERDPLLMQQYLRARAYFTISNSALNEALAVIAVRFREKIYSRVGSVASANLKLLDQFFAEHSDLFGWVRPRGGMTAFPWLKSDSDARAFCRALADRGVLLAPGDCFDMPSHFRLGFAASDNTFPQALERFARFIKGSSIELLRAGDD